MIIDDAPKYGVDHPITIQLTKLEMRVLSRMILFGEEFIGGEDLTQHEGWTDEEYDLTMDVADPFRRFVSKET